MQGLVEGNDYTLTADGIRLLWPVRPGPSSAQISFTFQLPAGAAVDYSQRVAYPVQALCGEVSWWRCTLPRAVRGRVCTRCSSLGAQNAGIVAAT